MKRATLRGASRRGPLKAKRFSQPRPSLIQGYRSQASKQLRRFRQGTLLSVSITSFLLLLWDSSRSLAQAVEEDEESASVALSQASESIQNLITSFLAFLPKVLIAATIAVLGWLLSKVLKRFFKRFDFKGQRAAIFIALSQIGLFVMIVVAALSVLVGDIRALLGSLGLVGLALSWALQAPIESFAGWVLNTFQSYYRVGDRIEVGEVFGDVYRIDVLTTTVWEAGGPGKAIAGAQPTGTLITFPNSEVLRSNITNFSKDFPYIWDEVTFGVANESDISYAVNLIRDTAKKIIGPEMSESADSYQRLLMRSNLEYQIEDLPQVYLSLTDSWTNCTVRYLVGVRERRKWSSLMIEKINLELAQPTHKGKVIPSYPRTEVSLRSP